MGCRVCVLEYNLIEIGGRDRLMVRCIHLSDSNTVLSIAHLDMVDFPNVRSRTCGRNRLEERPGYRRELKTYSSRDASLVFLIGQKRRARKGDSEVNA